MRNVRGLGMILLAAAALSGFGATCAIASSFLASHTGKISGSGRNTQKFKFAAGTLECSTLSVGATVTSIKALNLLAHAQYSGCTAFGFTVVNPSALLLFSADLKLSVDSDIVFNLPAAGCSLLIGLVGNQNLSSVYYDPASVDLKPIVSVKGLTYTSTGGACGASGNNGEYTGIILFFGSTHWDKE